MKEMLSFDDVLLFPQFSPLDSRSEADPTTYLGFGGHTWFLETPIISSPMTTVSGVEMVREMHRNGAYGVLHRYPPINNYDRINVVDIAGIAVSPSMGSNFDFSYDKKDTVLFVDVAHGGAERSIRYIEELKMKGYIVVSGNVATVHTAMLCLDAGADALRVGIGGGSACTTRLVTGVGVPQLSAILTLREALPDATLISDGGHKNTGDIIKALAAGADAVMLGGMLAGCAECPVEFTENGYAPFMGMASEEALRKAGKEVRVEGVSGHVPYKGPVKDVLKRIHMSIQDGMSYLGARNLTMLRENAEFMKITESGYKEGLPRV